MQRERQKQMQVLRLVADKNVCNFAQDDRFWVSWNVGEGHTTARPSGRVYTFPPIANCAMDWQPFCSGWGGRQVRWEQQRQQQIPFGDDNKKGKSKSKSKSKKNATGNRAPVWLNAQRDSLSHPFRQTWVMLRDVA
jgi:hypothetical protein